MNMLEEQYRRGEKVRLKNKHEERLLQHEIESHRGMRDVHKYRLQIVQREQKEISRELDRIRMGIKRNLQVDMSPDWCGSSHPDSDGTTRKVNQFHNRSTANLSPRRHQGPKLKSLSMNLSRRQMSFDDATGSDKDVTDVEIKSYSDEGKDDEKIDDGRDRDSNSDSFSSFDEKEGESIPDPDILKAIMNGIVGDWEENVIRTLSSTRNNFNPKLSLGVNISKHRRDNGSSPYSNANDSITPRKSLAGNTGRDSNLKPPSNRTSAREPLSTSTNTSNQGRRKKSSLLIGRQRHESPSAVWESQKAGKQKRSQFYDTGDRNKGRSPVKQSNQLTQHSLDTTRETVATKGNSTSSRVTTRVPSSFYRQTQTNYQSALRVEREGRREISEEHKNSELLKNKLPTLEGKAGDRKATALLASASSRKRPTGTISYSARDNLNPNYSSQQNIDTVLSSRSDGYPAIKNGVQSGYSMKTSLNSDDESVHNSDNVERQPAKFDFTTNRKRHFKDGKQSSRDENGDSETRMVNKMKDYSNDHRDRGSGLFDKSGKIHKNPRLHVFNKTNSHR